MTLKIGMFKATLLSGFRVQHILHVPTSVMKLSKEADLRVQ